VRIFDNRHTVSEFLVSSNGGKACPLTFARKQVRFKTITRYTVGMKNDAAPVASTIGPFQCDFQNRGALSPVGGRGTLVAISQRLYEGVGWIR